MSLSLMLVETGGDEEAGILFRFSRIQNVCECLALQLVHHPTYVIYKSRHYSIIEAIFTL